MSLRLGFFISIVVTTLSACGSTPPPLNAAPHAVRAASPASLNCLQNHGKLDIRQTPEGERADCVLPSGKRCDEWEMFRGNCPTRTVNANGIFGF
ncbi:MAG: DUF333 domain-containing protein [Candidatus Thiothrix putei]|uniref:Hemolysin n=2 Tax=Thiothrix TaxID=1030 RepID=A0A1H4GVF2_9GAMM|nr:DUF333 domain-containing protein [Thiothrix caldifontis]WGZ92533.1 MAG: DUF333 domain-containing protein [Candidatus Thiothrix putei]SEB13586.1 hypothetical protein SAMN05660964_03749 [Thiothrix caldifontis]